MNVLKDIIKSDLQVENAHPAIITSNITISLFTYKNTSGLVLHGLYLDGTGCLNYIVTGSTKDLLKSS